MEYEEWKKKFANGMEKSTMDDLLASIDLLAGRGMLKSAKGFPTPRTQFRPTKKFNKLLEETSEGLEEEAPDFLIAWAERTALRILGGNEPIYFDDVNPKDAGKLASFILGFLRGMKERAEKRSLSVDT